MLKNVIYFYFTDKLKINIYVILLTPLPPFVHQLCKHFLYDGIWPETDHHLVIADSLLNPAGSIRRPKLRGKVWEVPFTLGFLREIVR